MWKRFGASPNETEFKVKGETFFWETSKYFEEGLGTRKTRDYNNLAESLEHENDTNFKTIHNSKTTKARVQSKKNDQYDSDTEDTSSDSESDSDCDLD